MRTRLAEMAVLNEHYETAMRSVSDEERVVLDARLALCSWEEVADLAGLPSAEAARKKYERLIDRLRWDHPDAGAA